MKITGSTPAPLARKLGIKEHFNLKVINGPHYYYTLFSDFPSEAKEINGSRKKADLVHYFTMNKNYLLKDIKKLKSSIRKDGMIWVSWPRKSSGILTDISEDIIRRIAIKNGLVDIKVCAVDEIWSALKLVIPLSKRKKRAATSGK
jgi:hypothetical protein